MRFYLKSFGILCLLSVILFIGFAYGGWVNPFKERATWAPGFNPRAFKFEDYQKPDELNKNLFYLLKPGMTMQEVDLILVESAGAKKSFVGQAIGANKYRYHYKPWYVKFRMGSIEYFGWRVFITYDDNNFLISYTLSGP